MSATANKDNSEEVAMSKWWDEDSSYFDAQNAADELRNIRALRRHNRTEPDPGPPPPPGWPPELSVEEKEQYEAELKGDDAASQPRERDKLDRPETGTPIQFRGSPPPRRPSP